MKKIAFFIMLATVFSKSIGFFREIVLAYFYGASNISDVYLISMTIPNVIFSFIGVGISTTYIPIYNDLLENHGIKEGNSFSSNLINLILILSTILVLVFLIFSKPIVKAFASGFEADTLNTAISFARISIFAIYFKGLNYIFKSYLQVHNNFNIPAIMGIPFNILIILSIFLSVQFNKFLLAYGIIIAVGFQTLILLLFALKNGFKYRFSFFDKSGEIKKMFLLSMPVILGTSVNQINILVDRTLASKISIGGISSLNYANRLNGFVQGVFVISVVTVMYPLISKMINQNKMDEFKKYILESIIIMSLIVIPASFGFVIFSKEIIALLYGRGAFNQSAVNMTANVLVFYAVGMFGIGLREILSRVFYSVKDTKTPMINAIIGMIVNIILNLVLSRYIGLAGLALATSLSAILTAVLMFISLRKKFELFSIKDLSTSFFKILFASTIMAVLVKIFYNFFIFNMDNTLLLFLSILLGIIIYFFIITKLKIKEVEDIFILLKKRLYNIF